MIAKFLNSATIDVFLGTLFSFCKGGILVLLVVTQWKFAVWYLIIIVAIFILFHQPEYQGPSKAELWIGVDFDRKATLSDLTKEEKKVANCAAFVMCYTQWATNCSALSPLLAQLSMEYSSDYFTFARIDIGRAHHVAEKCMIDTSTSSQQLPTFILFENGEEIARLPQFSTAGKIIKSNFTKVRQYILSNFIKSN